MTAFRCTCRFGRDHDGSEFGPCEFCEEAEYEALLEEKYEADLEAAYQTDMDAALALDRQKLIDLGQDPGPTWEDLF